MKKLRRKEILELILKQLEKRYMYSRGSLYMCVIAYHLYQIDIIQCDELVEIQSYIIRKRPKFNSTLMDKTLKEQYCNILKMTAKKYDDPKHKPHFIWEGDNYKQRKEWLLLHIKKNS